MPKSFVSQTVGYRWRSRWSGGEARGAGGREWALDEPRPEPVEVDGGGCGHALQAHLGQPAVAGAARAEGAHALRDRALDASTLAVEPPARLRFQPRPGGCERLVLR